MTSLLAFEARLAPSQYVPQILETRDQGAVAPVRVVTVTAYRTRQFYPKPSRRPLVEILVPGNVVDERNSPSYERGVGNRASP